MSKVGRSILTFLSIKLEVETHKKYKKVISKITYICFAFFLIYGILNFIMIYNHIHFILDDTVYTKADVELLDYDYSAKQSLHRYSFYIDDQKFEDDIVIDDDNYDTLTQYNTIEIAYKKSNPAYFETIRHIERNKSIGNLVKRFFMMVIFCGLTFYVIYLFFTIGIVRSIEQYDNND